MQEDVDTHDTERNTSSEVDAFGLSITDHEMPFHYTTNVSVAEPVSVSVSVAPTARHHTLDKQDTERNRSFLLPAFGLSTIVQELPSHVSINVSVAEPVEVEPTATHHSVDTHETENNISLTVPEVGLSTIVQKLPSHISINVSTPKSVPVEPTATHHEVDTHDTDDK